MNTYELVVVLPGKATPAKKKALKEKMGKLIKTLKGKIVSTKDLGKKDLAYKIKKNETGAFLLFVVELDGAAAKQIAEKLNLDEEIIRYLFIKK